MGISIGLVGLGAFGSAFADLFKSHPLVDRVGLCDREADRVRQFADREDWRDKFDEKDAFETIDEMLKADFDAVAIITQPWLHAPQAVAALEAGKHVYSAVPVIMLPDGDEILEWCDRIVETVQRTGKRYMLGETTWFRAETMFCRRQATAGAFGDFVYAQGEYFHDFEKGKLIQVREHRTASASGKEWLEIEKRYNARGILEGPMHYPTHSVSGPMAVMGAHATKVSAIGFQPRRGADFYRDRAAFANETAFFQMSNGATMRVCEFREVAFPCKETFQIWGNRGSFHRGTWYDLENDPRTLTDDAMRDALPEEVDAAFKKEDRSSKAYGGHGGSHAFLVHEFVDAVASDRQPLVNAWEAARYMAAGVAAHKSALKDGEWLDVPDWGEAGE